MPDSNTDSDLKSCLYLGRVQHRRMRPFEHQFEYRLFMVYLDLQELDDVFGKKWTWSTRRAAIAWFRREDHFGDPDVPLNDSVANLVDLELGYCPTGPIRMLTHLRYFGYVMNPVSFYYCFAAEEDRVEVVVAEVNNTPWGEQHCYVLDLRTSSDSRLLTTGHDKEFHVSPFMPMEMQYRWKLSLPDESLSVSIENWREGSRAFSATMSMQRQPMTSRNLNHVLLSYPFMTGRVLTGIYWQALKLWWKGAKYHPHPKKQLSHSNSF
ncbi:DUF1365 domain-containing protein [Thalassoglobus sp. JC818]|uniref:DUF1365 domain-containing protein n=1 Tax=Thalassoglobus sp. JC818 TaxID=3232136 RepID=UPI0034574820